jgi:hypothetical protein
VTTLDAWSQELLSFGDWPITYEKRVGITAWAMAEGDINVPSCSGALWNPLDTEEPAPGATDFNAAGVKNYPSEQVGIEAVYATLHNGHYPGILAVLGNEGAGAMSLAQAVGNSPWGTGNFSWAVERVKADPARYLEVPVPGTSSPSPTPKEAEEVTSQVIGSQTHVWGIDPRTNAPTHWWQDSQEPGTPWHSETLPG